CERAPAVFTPRCDTVEQRESHGGALESEPAQVWIDGREPARQRDESSLLQRCVIAIQECDSDLLQTLAGTVFARDETASSEARLSSRKTQEASARLPE